MLTTNVFKKTKTPLSTPHRVRTMSWLYGYTRRCIFPPPLILQKYLAGMYTLCMTVGSSGQGMVLSHEDWDPADHVALLRGKTAVFGVRLLRIMQRLRQKFELPLVPQ
ncbi:uncharacterized protein TNCV_449751 [Trichonephila clavipes]|nr:uncharacterized protein TNCV_449751 [Trichonephila clavipes]